ncbi:glycerol-3-phosphate dehydrogenase [Kaistia nematophila]|uniref:Glycerol-3-phosphate dehydrogenase n=1 Tax=Kaistia nematophila TaxID=2994654 RepID=A0A9X3IKG2_9HYPH|nr:glycerol-3-phosphate dehydrogenase [Kaistia nematophila]MCX5569569.1 glycerol-3-phosphate dehydrogenase [Kaistia nematophila]
MLDIFIIGGGINGCGIARDAVGRGFSVGLAEMDDLASGTSSRSTKLVHGGLRYLEHYEFRLVRESLMEREVLWASAPHIIHPLRFVLPHHKGLRPAWLLRLGLFLYDHLGGRKLLPKTKTLDLTRDPAGRPLKGDYRRGFEYSDCWVDDARLVTLVARDAADRGVDVSTRTRVTRAERVGDHWRITLHDRLSDETRQVEARLLINAAGPWVDRVLRELPDGDAGHHVRHNVRLVQGSHIVVPKMFDHDRCYIFQNADGRIIFAIPYEGDFTLIGTTDRDYKGDLKAIAISDEETDYLCAAASEYFKQPVKREAIVWSYAGVRPLYDDGASSAQEATREYVLKVDGAAEASKIINVFGGKITTYRKLAEHVLQHVEAVLGRRGPAWTAKATLPGGDFPVDGVEATLAALAARYPAIDRSLIERLVRHYGTRTRDILGAARNEAELGRAFGAGLTQAEVHYLIEQEWARSAADIVWRRSKLGLRMTAAEIAALDAYVQAALAERISAAAQ